MTWLCYAHIHGVSKTTRRSREKKDTHETHGRKFFGGTYDFERARGGRARYRTEDARGMRQDAHTHTHAHLVYVFLDTVDLYA